MLLFFFMYSAVDIYSVQLFAGFCAVPQAHRDEMFMALALKTLTGHWWGRLMKEALKVIPAVKLDILDPVLTLPLSSGVNLGHLLKLSRLQSLY